MVKNQVNSIPLFLSKNPSQSDPYKIQKDVLRKKDKSIKGLVLLFESSKFSCRNAQEARLSILRKKVSISIELISKHLLGVFKVFLQRGLFSCIFDSFHQDVERRSEGL